MKISKPNFVEGALIELVSGCLVMALAALAHPTPFSLFIAAIAGAMIGQGVINIGFFYQGLRLDDDD
jgi:hypothetical protein